MSKISLVSDLHVQNVCAVGRGSMQCRYLGQGKGADGEGHYCLKAAQPERQMIDLEVAGVLSRADRDGKNPRDLGLALSNNCEGWSDIDKKKVRA